ncbi:hypothetical protein BOS5A_200243 [Bosea sp. EC-HK365B]|nr:hypothetical protein BOSE21B_100243 [Bosea sp. 21B]CAD5284999.1 hypothetical protein BOSE7B_41289 [Bosea sp. 7B]VVT57731.1 hypothetical protein BOS5A_200243 [Bosea sp. EC-HK365B]VXC92398.1 hypothetical protein BOSE127_80072 [Bosea sp. 127]
MLGFFMSCPVRSALSLFVRRRFKSDRFRSSWGLSGPCESAGRSPHAVLPRDPDRGRRQGSLRLSNG